MNIIKNLIFGSIKPIHCETIYDHTVINEISNNITTDTIVKGSDIQQNPIYKNNRYFAIIDKRKIKDTYGHYKGDFCGGHRFAEQLQIWKYDPEKHCIIEAVLTDKTKYFIESYQAISSIDDQKYFTIVYDPTSAFASIPNFKDITTS